MINILEGCPYPDLAPIFSLVRYLISIVSVVVPIILIVLGIIDFSKAVMAKDEKDIKTNQSIFIRRVIYAVAIFFVYTIVVFITNLVAKYFPDEGATSWIDCFNYHGYGFFPKKLNNGGSCYLCDGSQNGKYIWTDTPSSQCNKTNLTKSECINIVNYNLNYEDNNTENIQRCCYTFTLKLSSGDFVVPNSVRYKFNEKWTSDNCNVVENSDKCSIDGIVPTEVIASYGGFTCRIIWTGSGYRDANPFCVRQ